jgi:hypothetical protein
VIQLQPAVGMIHSDDECDSASDSDTVNDSKSAGRLTLVCERGNRSPRRLWQLRRICSTAAVQPHRDCDRTDPGPVIPNNVTAIIISIKH